MAYADSIHGPWRIHRAGVLPLQDTVCRNHIASPDVHICEDQRSFRMYFHGVTDEGQCSFLATSSDGLVFKALPEVLGPFYFRVFRHASAWFAIAKTTDAPGGGVLLRSVDGVQSFERGPDILPNQRHVAVLKREDMIHIFFSRGEDSPECILVSCMPLSGNWKSWQPSDPIEVLRPETDAEVAHLPIQPSRFGSIHKPVHELRDPAVFEEDGHLYLFYTGAGETNICGSELFVHGVNAVSLDPEQEA